MSKPKPPEHLAAPGRELWTAVVGKYTLRPDELRTLEDACATTDMLATLEKEWRDAGRPFMSRGSMGQEVEHPLIGSIDKLRKSRQSFFRQLKLPEDGTSTGAGATNANPARAAAATRWKHGS
jgi:hypothetical protein